MNRLNPFRRRWSLMTAAGIALSVLIGSGLLAMVTDRAFSNGNSVTSGDFNGIQTLQLMAADSPQNVECNGTFSPGPVAPIVVHTADLNGGIVSGERKFICAITTKQVGQQRLHFQFTNVVDTEAACSNGGVYPESGEDPTCGGSNVGELSRLLRVVVTADRISNGQVVSCGTPSFVGSLQDFVATAGESEDVARRLCPIVYREVVRVTVVVRLNDALPFDERHRLLVASQSDKVQWNIQFSLAEG